MVVGQNDAGSDANPVYRRTTSTGTGPGAMQLDIWSSINQGGSWSIIQPADATGHTFIQQVNATAVPEPSSLVLLCAVGIALSGYGWRRRKLSEN